MKTLVQKQLDDSQRGLEILDESKKETAIIKNNLEAIDSLCISSQGLINNFPEIKKVFIIKILLCISRNYFIYLFL